MTTTVVTSVAVVLALLLAALTGYRALRDRPIRMLELVAAGVVELSALVYVGVRTAALIDGHHVSSHGLVIAYLVGVALVLPIAAALAIAEPTRWGSVTLGVGALVVCVLFARVSQLWSPHG